MTHSLTALSTLLLASCVVAETFYQITFKVIANRAHADRPFASVIFQPLLWLAIGLWAVETIAWILVLRQAALTIAFPLMCATYAAVPLAGAFLLKEKLTPRQLIGVALVFFGVLAVSISAADGGGA